MRVVLDTNVAIAGLLWRGKPYELLGHVLDGKMQCFASAPLIEELERVLGYDTKHAQANGVELDELVNQLLQRRSR
jgi:putative PIN family toxin of toxin-antitoxin system